MKIKLFLLFLLFSVPLFAWEGAFTLSEEAQKKANFYNQFITALTLENANKQSKALPLLKELLTEKPEDKTLILEYCFLALDHQKEEFDFCKNTLENIEEKIVDNAINPELIFDWMVYRDDEGRGIFALINEKVCDIDDLKDYNAGGDAVYEFARFQRKYYTYKKTKETKSKESAQEAFRNAVAQQIATQITTQQLLSGKDPMEFVNMLFEKPDFENSINEITKSFAKNKDRPLQITHKKKK